MLEGISEVLNFVVLGRDLSGSSEEAMKVSMKFGKNRVVLSWRFDGLQPFEDKVEVRLVEDSILIILHMREHITQDYIHHTETRVPEERNVVGGKCGYCLAGEVRKRLQDVSLIGGVDVVKLYGDGRGIISRDRNGI